MNNHHWNAAKSQNAARKFFCHQNSLVYSLLYCTHWNLGTWEKVAANKHMAGLLIKKCMHTHSKHITKKRLGETDSLYVILIKSIISFLSVPQAECHANIVPQLHIKLQSPFADQINKPT